LTYKIFQEIRKDINYGEHIKYYERYSNQLNDYESVIDYKKRKLTNQLKQIWFEYIREKYEKTKNSNTTLGRFIEKFPLPFKEMLVLIYLIENKQTFEPESKTEIFKKYKVNYERSLLKKLKLVYLVKDPRKPMEEEYVVSYKCQLQIIGGKYTEEYKQLDFELEEQTSKKGIDAIETFYYTVKPQQRLNELIVDEKTKNQLEIGIKRAINQKEFLKKNNLARSMPYGKGVTINFRGVPGTGKTMAAHCFAKEINKELLIVRYDQVQSMWVGETEKHIQQVFKLAKIKNAVLFFDEADALAHDRSILEKSWEISQVNTLLKELERFEGVCIFATNFAERYDKAFERRLTMHINFPMPKKEESSIILKKLLPPRMRSEDINFQTLNLEGLTGGLLKNVVLNAYGIINLEGKSKVEQKHLIESIEMIRSKNQKEKTENDLSYIG